MNCEPIISVIVPIYKVEKYLDKCVQSLLNQTYSNLEIILVDDGSPDSCPNICDEYQKKDNRVRSVHKENGGLASARNFGLDIASGDLIAFLDSDDWLDLDTYERLLKAMKDKNADIVCMEGTHTDGEKFYDRCFCCKPTGTVVSGEEMTKQILLDNVPSCVVVGLYKRECWQNIRFPLGRLYEDLPTTFRAFKRAGRVTFVDETFYKYRKNMKSISYTPNPIKTYHQFLGYKTHYESAKEKYPEIFRDVTALTAHYATSTYFHYCTDAHSELGQYICEVESFLDENKKNINFANIIRSRRYALRLYYFSKPLFKVMCKILVITGLQKKLGLEIK
ncbi:MAG: glycosyltransferase [Clostridiales bacterium]|nr:glycosyltransferase [Clostridiales bacterium]